MQDSWSGNRWKTLMRSISASLLSDYDRIVRDQPLFVKPLTTQSEDYLERERGVEPPTLCLGNSPSVVSF